MIRIELADPIDLGAEFVRWEVATAIAGGRPRHRPVRPAERRGRRSSSPATSSPAASTGRVRPTALAGPRRERRRTRPAWRRGAPAHLGRRRRRGRAGFVTWRAEAPGQPTCASRRSSPRPRPATRRSPGSGRSCGTGPAGDHGRLRAAVPPLHGPAPPGREGSASRVFSLNRAPRIRLTPPMVGAPGCGASAGLFRQSRTRRW